MDGFAFSDKDLSVPVDRETDIRTREGGRQDFVERLRVRPDIDLCAVEIGVVIVMEVVASPGLLFQLFEEIRDRGLFEIYRDAVMLIRLGKRSLSQR